MKKYYLLTLIFTVCTFLFIMAQDKDTLQFSHQYHIEEEDLECADCHAVTESTTGRDNLLPAKDVCADCHDVEDDSGCDQCHTNAEIATKANRIIEYSQLFSHEKHLGAGLECASCHGEAAEIGIGSHMMIPDMMACMDCHQTQSVSVECMTCHTSDERLKPVSHDLAFIKTHGNLAQFNASSSKMAKDCATCHDNNFCQDCHEGENIERFTHPLNFEFTHALLAQGKERSCFKCHDDRDYCSTCHLTNNVLPQNHTAGWTNNIDGDGGRHRIEAIIDLENCMTCHEHNAEQICQPCHNNE